MIVSYLMFNLIDIIERRCTGLAQVSGRNLVDWDRRLELDVQYVENMSIVLDFSILLKTLLVTVRSEGVAVNTIDVEPALNSERENHSHKS